MQKSLHDNDVLISSTHNEGNSVVAKKFIKILKGKIYKTKSTDDSKSYLSYVKSWKVSKWMQ